MSPNLSLLMEALARPSKVFIPPRDIAEAEARTLAAVRQLGALRIDDPARIDAMHEITNLSRFLNDAVQPKNAAAPTKGEPLTHDAAPKARPGEWVPQFTDALTEHAFQAMLKKLTPSNSIAFRAALRVHTENEQAKEPDPKVKLTLTTACLSDALNDCLAPIDRDVRDALERDHLGDRSIRLLMRESNFRAAGAALAAAVGF